MKDVQEVLSKLKQSAFRNRIHLQQKEAFSDITVKAADNFEEALGSEQAITAAEQEYH